MLDYDQAVDDGSDSAVGFAALNFFQAD
jgi:hypothetical protein